MNGIPAADLIGELIYPKFGIEMERAHRKVAVVEAAIDIGLGAGRSKQADTCQQGAGGNAAEADLQ
jgi:hypothetical protein